MDRQQAKAFCQEQYNKGLRADQIAQALIKSGYKTVHNTAPSLGHVYDLIDINKSRETGAHIGRGKGMRHPKRPSIKTQVKALYKNGMKPMDILGELIKSGVRTSQGNIPTKAYVYHILKLRKFKINRPSPKKGVTYNVTKKKPSFEMAEAGNYVAAANVTQEVNFSKMLASILKNTKLSAEKRIAMALLALE